MKKFLLGTALATSLLIQFPACADDSMARARPISPQLEAFYAAAWELKGAFDSGKGNPIPQLDKMAADQFSPPTRGKLEKAYGPGKGLTLKQAPAAPGKVAYSIVLPANKFLDAEMTEMAWTKLDGLMVIDTEGRNAVTTAHWASISAKGKDSHVAFSDMSLEGSKTRPASDIWLGKAVAKVARMTVTTEKNPAIGVLEDITFVTKVDQHDKLLDIAYELQIKSIKISDVGLDNVRFISRLTNVDVKAWERFTAALREMRDPKLSDKENSLKENQAFVAFGKSMAAHGTTIALDEYSASFQGHKAMMSGTLSLAPAVDADFESMESIMPKMVTRFEARVPVALITAAAALFAPKPPAGERQAVTSKMIADMLIAPIVRRGFVVIENEVLVSKVEIQGGRMILNGKDLGMLDEPKLAPTGKVGKTGKAGKAGRKPAVKK